jgi:hypothetical protein
VDLTGLPPELAAERARVLGLASSFRGLTVEDAQDLAQAHGVELEVHTGGRAGRGALLPARLNIELGDGRRVHKTWVG